MFEQYILHFISYIDLKLNSVFIDSRKVLSFFMLRLKVPGKRNFFICAKIKVTV